MFDFVCFECREGDGRGDLVFLVGDLWWGGFGGEVVGVVVFVMLSEKVFCF